MKTSNKKNSMSTSLTHIPTICIEMDDLSISTDDILAAVKASVKETGLNESGH